MVLLLENPAPTGKNDLDLCCFSVEKKFFSRKNNVFLLRTNKLEGKAKYLILKKYPLRARMLTEIKLLSLLKKRGVAVPEIHGTGEDYILVEYLEGPLFLDFYCWQENVSGSGSSSLAGPAYQSIYSLCSWFKDFYAAVREVCGRQFIMGDVNFRNFIIGYKIYGIDLEECREGEIEEDIGSLCAYGLTYSPTFTPWKMAMIGTLFQILCHELNLNKELVREKIYQELLLLARRRGELKETLKFLASKPLDNINFT